MCVVSIRLGGLRTWPPPWPRTQTARRLRVAGPPRFTCPPAHTRPTLRRERSAQGGLGVVPPPGAPPSLKCAAQISGARRVREPRLGFVSLVEVKRTPFPGLRARARTVAAVPSAAQAPRPWEQGVRAQRVRAAKAILAPGRRPRGFGSGFARGLGRQTALGGARQVSPPQVGGCLTCCLACGDVCLSRSLSSLVQFESRAGVSPDTNLRPGSRASSLCRRARFRALRVCAGRAGLLGWYLGQTRVSRVPPARHPSGNSV